MPYAPSPSARRRGPPGDPTAEIRGVVEIVLLHAPLSASGVDGVDWHPREELGNLAWIADAPEKTEKAMKTRFAAANRVILTAAALAAVPAPAFAHEADGFGSLLHNLLHLVALGPDHGLRPAGILLVVLGGVIVLATVGRARGAGRALRGVGSVALLAGLALTLG